MVLCSIVWNCLVLCGIVWYCVVECGIGSYSFDKPTWLHISIVYGALPQHLHCIWATSVGSIKTHTMVFIVEMYILTAPLHWCLCVLCVSVRICVCVFVFVFVCAAMYVCMKICMYMFQSVNI